MASRALPLLAPLLPLQIPIPVARGVGALGDEISAEAVNRVWDDAMAATWERDPV